MQLLIEKDIFPFFSIAYETSIVIYGIYILADQPVQLMIHEFINKSTVHTIRHQLLQWGNSIFGDWTMNKTTGLLNSVIFLQCS